jgi:cytochrome c peroxidase
MFWDSRVSRNAASGFITPAGEMLPASLDSVLAAQAMFPVTSRDEMRGSLGDTDMRGRPNEVAAFSDYDFEGIWNALWERLMGVTAYRERFEVAFPESAVEELGFQHAANAIAAFEAAAFSPTDSPWDRYLSGDDRALSEEAKRGALLFYGKAGCANCHAGTLMTDQAHHNVGVPPLGPGKLGGLVDSGRGLLTMNEGDRFAFRTPPLRNVAVTGPWMHNGAYRRLEDVVVHLLDPETALHGYDPKEQLPAGLQSTVRLEEAMIDTVLATLDPLLQTPVELSETEFDALMSFLAALTSPSALDLTGEIPRAVPSGLPIDR